MKRLLSILAIAALALTSRAAPNITITNWVPNYVSVLNSTDVGDTGLGVGTNYACFNMADFVLLTTNQADMTSGDVRQLQYALGAYLYGQFYASTNPPANGTVSESMNYDVTTNSVINTKYTITTKLDISTGISVIPSE